MQQINPQNSPGFLIQEGGKEGGIELRLDGVLTLPFRLTTQQARRLACDLIQSVNRADTITSLKTIPLKASNSTETNTFNNERIYETF